MKVVLNAHEYKKHEASGLYIGLSLRAAEMFYALKGRSIYFYGLSRTIDENFVRTNIDGHASDGELCRFIRASLTYLGDVVPEERLLYKKSEELKKDLNGVPRTDPDLVQVVEMLGEKAGDTRSKPKVVEVPDDMQWKILRDLNRGRECLVDMKGVIY